MGGEDVDRYWDELDAAQASGQACVVCARRLSRGWRDRRGPASVMVGRSRTGSPVFACAGACTERVPVILPSQASPDPHPTRPAAGAVAIPDEALTAAGAAFVAALEAAGGDLNRAWPDDLVTATVTAAAPVIVAAELRRVAAEMDPGPAEAVATSATAVNAGRARELWAGYLRVRADELDPASGGEPR